MRTARSLTASHSIRCGEGGKHARGMCMVGGVRAMHNPPPLWTEFLTHACENINFPQLLLWAVKI